MVEGKEEGRLVVVIRLFGRMCCQLGFHDWVFRQPVFPDVGAGKIRYPRVCVRCEKERGK